MLTATQALAAAHTQSHGPFSLTSRVVSPVPRRRQARRNASKISCRSSSYGVGNGEAGVVLVDRPEPAHVKQQEATVSMKARVTVHMKSEPGFFSKLAEFLTKSWLSIELFSNEVDPGEIDWEAPVH